MKSVANPAPPTSWVGESGDPQFGVALLEREQFVEQRVEVRVGDDRRVLDVVAELVFAYLVGELLPAPSHLRVDRIGFRIA